MRAKTNGIKKHSGRHNDIIHFTTVLVNEGFDTPEKVAYEIGEREWMSPESKTGSDYKSILIEVKRTWTKALQQLEAGESNEKRLKDFEKLRNAVDLVNTRVKFDTFTHQYLLEDNTETSPTQEYIWYNSKANDKTFIEKHFFVSAFEGGGIKKCNTIKEWADTLPKWDKKDHLKKLAAFIPAKDPKQAELFLKGWLIRAYIQAVNPMNQDAASIVNRWFLILHQHRQDSGKSSFFRWVAPQPGWVKENGLEDNKDGYIALARYMFVLDDELGGLSRVQQHERLKSMISTSKIDVRLPYGKTDVSFDRVASFCGSTNNEDIFPSSEGTTRFLLLPLTEEVFPWERYIKEVDRTKLWSQVKHLAATSWLKDNTEAIAKYRSETNVNYIKEDMENFVVSKYVRHDPDSNVVMRAGDVMHIVKGLDYGYNNLIMYKLGQALKKQFGERVNGVNPQGQRSKGYLIKILPPEPESLGVKRVTERGIFESKPGKVFKVKKRKKSQR